MQWGVVRNGARPANLTWAGQIDGNHKAVRDGGGLEHVVVTCDGDGDWTVACKDWNQGAGGSFEFSDGTVASFSRVVLVAPKTSRAGVQPCPTQREHSTRASGNEERHRAARHRSEGLQAGVFR